MDIRRRNLMGQVSITANVTIENIKGSWGESSKTISGYRVYESKGSYHVNSGYDLAKVTFSGYPNFTFLYGSYAESSYDYMKVSPLDYSSAQNWTESSSNGHLLSTSGKQNSSAPNLSYTFTNDGGEHFFYILYRKDSSVNSGADRGYIAFRDSNYLEIDNLQISVSHSQLSVSCNITSDMAWSVTTSADWVAVDKISGSGNASLSITLSLNEATTSRTGIVTISSELHTRVINVTQAAYDISVPSSISVAFNKDVTISVQAELGLELISDCDWLRCNIVLNNNVYTITFTVLTESTETRNTIITLKSNGITKTVTVIHTLFQGIVLEFANTSSLSEFFLEHCGGVGDTYKIGEDGEEVALADYASFTDTYILFPFSLLSGLNLYINTPGTAPVSSNGGWSTYKGIKRRSGGLKVINLQNAAPYTAFVVYQNSAYPELEDILLPTTFNYAYIRLDIPSSKNRIIINRLTLCILGWVEGASNNIEFQDGVYHNIVLYMNNSASKTFILEKAPTTDNGYIAIRPSVSLSDNEVQALTDKGWTIIQVTSDLDMFRYNYFN